MLSKSDRLEEKLLKQRIRKEAELAQKTITNFLRIRHEKLKHRFYRRIGLLEATVYLEKADIVRYECLGLNPNSTVRVFGEFSPHEPWQVFVPCVFNKTYNCFEADIFIRLGQSFKFQVDHGRFYLTSSRYPTKCDPIGNINNYYDPK